MMETMNEGEQIAFDASHFKVTAYRVEGTVRADGLAAILSLNDAFIELGEDELRYLLALPVEQIYSSVSDNFNELCIKYYKFTNTNSYALFLLRYNTEKTYNVR